MTTIQSIYSNPPIFETERLLLRKIAATDLDDMFRYASDPEVTKYVLWDTHQTLEDTRQFLDYALEAYRNEDVSPWGIECKENGKFIGTIDFVSWSERHRTAEIGYTIGRPYWGKGYMTEAARELLKFGFEHMDLLRIQARCFPENIGSERVMQKLGMTYEGTLRQAMNLRGTQMDLKQYSILREEFFSNEGH